MAINKKILDKAGYFRGPLTLKFPYWRNQLGSPTVQMLWSEWHPCQLPNRQVFFQRQVWKKHAFKFDSILYSQDCQVKFHHIFFEGVCFQTKYVNIWQIIWLMGRIQETSWDGENTWDIFLLDPLVQDIVELIWAVCLQIKGGRFHFKLLTTHDNSTTLLECI